MQPRRHHLLWATLGLFLLGQCGGAVTPTNPGTAGSGASPGRGGTGGSGASNPGGRGGSSAPTTGGSGANPTGGSSATGGSGGNNTGGRSGQDAGRPPDAAPDPVDPPTTDPPAPPSGPGANPGSPPAGPAGPWARAIQIGLVEVSQTTFVKLGDGTQVVPAAMRNAPLIEGRPLVVRVHVTPGAGYTPRALRGVVAIESGGSSKQFEESKMIAGPSDPTKTATTFNVLIPAADVKPASNLWVALYESGMPAGADPAPPPRFPAEGGVDLAVKAGRMVLDVVGVPVTGVGGPLADTPERRKKLENDIYDIYPVQKVNLKIRAPVTVTATITERAAAFGLLRDARTADGASARPWEYYHLLVAREDTTFTFAGTAGGGGGSNNDPGSRRVALTLVRGRALDGNTNTTVHELGHNHGLGHVPVCGADGGVDGYPYPAGAIGPNGWSLSENALKGAATYKELMGYCRPRWISDWIYSRFETRVRMVSATVTTPPSTMALAERSLLGYMGPGERPNWGVVAERLVDSSTTMTGNRYARLVLDDGRVVRAPVTVNLMSDGVTQEFAVSLPAGASTDHADVVIDGRTMPVSVPSLFGPLRADPSGDPTAIGNKIRPM